MGLPLGKIQFGEIDAKHEVFTQAREGSYLLLNAFQMPPSVSFQRLLSGAKFFISGAKGSGKTSLMLYLKHIVERDGGRGHIVLFKSRLTDTERQRIAPIADLTAFTDQDKIRFEQDYKANWLWYIISEISRLVEPSDALDGKDELNDLRILTGASASNRTSILSGLQLTKIKGTIETALSAGPFRTSVKAEIEAIKSVKEHAFADIVDICERLLYKVKLLPGRKACLFFDELELFIGRIDQKDRDLYLIRDLLYAVSRVNQGFGPESSRMCVYACVRSEVMYEINRIYPEIDRDVADFGVKVDWFGTAASEDQAILNIVSAKIIQSEIEEAAPPTENVWSEYFESRLDNKDARQFLLDISMFKPRTLVMLLSAISKYVPNSSMITSSVVSDVEPSFSQEMWREVEEELRTSYDPQEAAAVKRSLRGLTQWMTVSKFEDHVLRLGSSDDQIKQCLGTRDKMMKLLNTLYRVGAVGTHFTVFEGGRRWPRDGWVFRHNYEPHFEGNFVFHSSLRKALQLVGSERPPKMPRSQARGRSGRTKDSRPPRRP